MLSMRTTDAGVRGVDEPASADVDPDVAEAVEEDEVAGCRRRDRLGRIPLRDGVVRERDPELRVDVHHEAGAVEAARARAAPDVRDAEILERDRGRLRMAGAGASGRHIDRRRRDDRRGGRGHRSRCFLRRLAGCELRSQARLRGGSCRPLLRRLLRLELRDRRVDGGEQAPLLSELGLDRALLRRPLADGLLTRLLQLLELQLTPLHRVLEVERVPSERCVLVRDRLRRLGALHDLREAVSAGKHLDRARGPVHVERVEARHEVLLRDLEVPLGDVQPVLVLPQGLVDETELLLRVPPLVLGHLQLLADLVDLGHDLAPMGLCRPDLRGRAGARHGRSPSHRECGEAKRAEEDETVTSHRNGVAKRTRSR